MDFLNISSTSFLSLLTFLLNIMLEVTKLLDSFDSLGYFATPNHGISGNVIGLMRKSFLKHYSQNLATTPLRQHLRSLNANEF